MEQAPPDRRGYYGSWSLFGCIGGILLGSAVGAFIHTIWAAEVHDWAWRVPFLAGLAVGLTGFILRRGLPESLSEQDKDEHTIPLAKAVREEGSAMAKVIGISVVNAVAFYMIFIYITVFLERQVGLPAATALDVNTLSMIAMLAMIPLFARLSDRIGRKPLLMGAAFGLLLLSYPLLWLMHHPDAETIFLGQLGFSALIGCYLAVQPTAMAEMFSPGVRCSGLAVAYNNHAGPGGRHHAHGVHLSDREDGRRLVHRLVFDGRRRDFAGGRADPEGNRQGAVALVVTGALQIGGGVLTFRE